MPVLGLSLDVWDGVRCGSRDADRPSWEQVEAALSDLDARRHTLLTLNGEAGDTLCVGGGAGRYVVFYQDADDELWNLHAAGAPEAGPSILLNCGGQEGDFRPDQVVGSDVAREAVRTLFAVGGIDVRLGWRRQD